MDIKNYAKIHSIETFGTVDGPGIRFVIFMQGCHLKCKYCHNRDSWDINTGNYISIDELLKKILRYKEYFAASGGGVTVSGGEPLLQAKFILSLFKKLKENSIHTAIDTSGIIDISKDIEKLLEYTDLVLLDIKHINSEECKNLVGFGNEKEINFARYLSNHNIPIWIRQVLIPGITDKEPDLLKLKEFILTLKTVEKIELLPYHDMGKFKWENLGLDYELSKISPATEEDIKKAKKILEI